MQCCSLQDAFSLLAYPDPWSSPVGFQLQPVQREPVCAALNSAILGQCLALFVTQVNREICSHPNELEPKQKTVPYAFFFFLSICQFGTNFSEVAG